MHTDITTYIHNYITIRMILMMCGDMVFICVLIYLLLRMGMHVYVCMCVFIYLCMYWCIYLCIYLVI